MDSNATLLISALAIGIFMFIVIALPKIFGDEKRTKDEEKNNNHANLIVMQPSLPAKSIPSPPEVKPHEHILGPGGTQWIYN